MNSPLAILKLLEKSNCRECGYATCLAFASAVFKGQKPLGDCPRLGGEVLTGQGGGQVTGVGKGEDPEEPLQEMKRKLAVMDLASAARRLGARYAGNRITVKVCGKDFSVDREGNFFSEIHVHSWITGPLLNYITEGKGEPVTGNWVSLRELKNGMDWHRFFVHQCERPIKQVADIYTDLFEDMLHIFNGKRVENHYQSDISLVLHPLPRIPILFCYWRPEDGLASSLNIFFDSTAGDNLQVKYIYSICTGLARMFEKIAQRHGSTPILP